MVIYEGKWENNIKNGEGIFIYGNGNKFNGKFINNKEYEGNGFIYYDNKDIYED